MSKKKDMVTMNFNNDLIVDKGVQTMDNQSDLTVDELITFKDAVALEIPERMKNGRPGVVFISELPAKEVLRIVGNKGDSNEWLFDLMASAVVNRDGSAMFTPLSLKKLSDAAFSVFSRIQAKVLELNPINNPGGENPLGATGSSESPTN
jgi:hypothetical protein